MKTERKRRCPEFSSFTLIEMLIVVAIIAILAGMLLPALNQAKRTAQRVVCINNFKQLNLIDLHYAGNYGDYGMPYQMYGMYNGKKDASNWHEILIKGSGARSVAVANYLGVKQFTRPFCPTGNANESDDIKYSQYGGHNNGLPGLNMCFHRGHYTPAAPGDDAYAVLPLTSIKNPSNVVHFGESKQKANPDIGKWWSSYTQFRHKAQMTTTFYDGHIEMRKKNQLSNTNFWAKTSGNK